MESLFRLSLVLSVFLIVVTGRLSQPKRIIERINLMDSEELQKMSSSGKSYVVLCHDEESESPISSVFEKAHGLFRRQQRGIAPPEFRLVDCNTVSPYLGGKSFADKLHLDTTEIEPTIFLFGHGFHVHQQIPSEYLSTGGKLFERVFFMLEHGRIKRINARDENESKEMLDNFNDENESNETMLENSDDGKAYVVLCHDEKSSLSTISSIYKEAHGIFLQGYEGWNYDEDGWSNDAPPEFLVVDCNVVLPNTQKSIANMYHLKMESRSPTIFVFHDDSKGAPVQIVGPEYQTTTGLMLVRGVVNILRFHGKKYSMALRKSEYDSWSNNAGRKYYWKDYITDQSKRFSRLSLPRLLWGMLVRIWEFGGFPKTKQP